MNQLEITISTSVVKHHFSWVEINYVQKNLINYELLNR